MPLYGGQSRPYTGGDGGLANRLWFPGSGVPSGVTGVMATGRQHFLPANFPGLLVDRIGINVTVGSPGNCRLGIYSNNNGIAGDLIIDCGLVDTTVIAAVEVAFTAIALPEWCWLSSIFEATPTVTVGANANPQTWGAFAFTGTAKGLNAVQAYGPMPAVAGTQTPATASTTPLLGVRKF